MRRLLLLLLFLLAAGCREQPQAVVTEIPLTIAAPTTLPAGATATIGVAHPDLPDGAPVRLLWIGGYGIQTVTQPAANGAAAIAIGPKITATAGAVRLVALAPGFRGSASLIVTPGTPVDPITPLVGARSVVADGAHWSMIVAVPFDRYGNPVADGTPVEIRAQRPDGTVDAESIAVNHLLAWTRLWSGTRAGRTTIAISSGTIRGPEGVLLEVPGPPIAPSIAAIPAALPADGRQLTTLSTGTLVDRYGNRLLDGTRVTFVIDDPDGTRRSLGAVTVDGVASVALQAGLTPGAATVRALAAGVSSPPTTVRFEPLAATLPVRLRTDNVMRALVVRVGPVLGPLGQFAPDGTPVRVHLQGPATADTFEIVTDAGYATLSVSLNRLSDGAYTVDVTTGSGRGRGALEINRP